MKHNSKTTGANTTLTHNVYPDRALAVVYLLYLAVYPACGAAAGEVSKLSKPGGLKKLKLKPWYEKVNTFVSISHENRAIVLERVSTLLTLDKETFSGNTRSDSLSLTSGGNLFKGTSVYLDLTLTRLDLKGEHQAIESESVHYRRNKTLTELFVEHKFNHRYSGGIDLYYGADKYRNAGDDLKRQDQEMGGGFSLTDQFRYQAVDIKVNYIFSHRSVNVSHNTKDDSSKNFHSLLSSLSYRWSYDLAADLVLRGSYYPRYDEFKYWESEFIWSVGGQLNYRLDNNSELSLNADRMAFGNSFSSMIALTYKYHFGSNDAKRRKRRHKLPNLLIK